MLFHGRDYKTELAIIIKTPLVSYFYCPFHHQQTKTKKTRKMIEMDCDEHQEFFFVKLSLRQKMFPLFPLIMTYFNCYPVHNMIHYKYGWKVPAHVTKSFSFSTSKFDLDTISCLDFRRFSWCIRRSICASFSVCTACGYSKD